MTLARRGIPSPARLSFTSWPTIGRDRTHRSNRGLDRAKAHAASTKKPVVGRPGTITPRLPSPTARKPTAIQTPRAAARRARPGAGAGVAPPAWFAGRRLGHPTRAATSLTMRMMTSTITLEPMRV